MEDISKRWPFWTEAEHTKQYYARVPVAEIWADPWHLGRLADCLRRCRENPDPPPVDLVRVDVKGLAHEFLPI